MRVLVAEDEEVTAEMLVSHLVDFGYDVTLARNGREAFERLRTGAYRMLVTDWRMPEMDGTELCRKIRQRHVSGYVYIILLTSNEGTANIVEGLNAGADEYLTKPFRPEELRVRLRTAERILTLESRDLTIFAMAKLAESRDPETGTHLERIREYCRLTAEELSTHPQYRDEVDGDFVQMIYLTSPLHDIGKVGIPDRILRKRGALTPAERHIMRQHTVIGGQTLEAAAAAFPEARFLSMAREIALTHHEWFDGNGYPRGMAGAAIPLCGRIVAVADVYDALTTRRVYKPPFRHEASKASMVASRGRQFDPNVLDAFFSREDEIRKLRRALRCAQPAPCRLAGPAASSRIRRPVPANLA